ncbi:sugar ABC transporter permease [Roseibium salinum]|nr:sugar ABC transporter permease [Roseibium salinum]
MGLANFQLALSDSALGAAAANTLIYVVSTTIAGGLLAFAVALILEGQALHIRIIRTAIFFPAVTSVAVLAEIWRILFYPASTGVVNSILGFFGGAPQGFMSDPNQALFVVILLQVWKNVPYSMVIFIAGLAGINRELYDAADVDGASPLRKLWHVTVPGLVPAFFRRDHAVAHPRVPGLHRSLHHHGRRAGGRDRGHHDQHLQDGIRTPRLRLRGGGVLHALCVHGGTDSRSCAHQEPFLPYVRKPHEDDLPPEACPWRRLHAAGDRFLRPLLGHPGHRIQQAHGPARPAAAMAE